MTPLLVSKRQAARLLGIGRGDTLSRLIASGRIRVVSVDGRLRIPLEEVHRVAREGTEPPPALRRGVRRSASRGLSVAEKIRAIEL